MLVGKPPVSWGGLAAIFGSLILAGLLATDVLTVSMGWYGVAGGIFGGAFAIFEARAGWCIVRALGFKTPLVTSRASERSRRAAGWTGCGSTTFGRQSLCGRG